MVRFDMRCALWFAVVPAVLAIGLFATASAEAGFVDGAVFSDDFNSGSVPNSTNWPTTGAVASTLTVGDGLVDFHTTDPTVSNTCMAISKAFTIPDPTAYAAEVRFRIPTGTTWVDTLRTSNHLTYNLIMSDGNGAQKGAFDVNLQQGTINTFGLTWGYWGGTGTSALTVLKTLNTDTWYDVISNRKADGTVDIYLDGELIANKTSLAGTPTKWFLGDGYSTVGYIEGHLQVDYVKVGAYVVPEPCSMVLVTTSVLGLLAYAWRKRK